MVITQYPHRAPPVALSHDLDEIQAAITVQFYATGPYLLDPLYQHCRANGAPGVYRLFDLANDAFLRSPYYRTFFRKIRISDEIGLLMRQESRGWIIISLARRARRPRFTDEERDRLQQAMPITEAAALRHWRDAAQPGSLGVVSQDDWLTNFGKGHLSSREQQIVQLVLLGHSSPSISAHLGITEGTVKVHRHNAYSKLRICSQAELFALAARHFAAAD